MTSQPSQYDAITTSYTSLYGAASSALPCALIEESNFKAAITPYLSSSPSRVLDLACGSGYYSRLFLDWGAASVVGVDISEGMLAEARDIQSNSTSSAIQDRLTFLHGDATNPSLHSKLTSHGAPFDLVTAAWLLNYAPDLATMTAMFRTISSCLKPGGAFIGLTIPPPLGNAEEVDRGLRDDSPKYGESGRVLATLPDDLGFKMQTVLGKPGMDIESWDVKFDNYYLRNWVFEQAARDSGLGILEWQPFVLTEEVRKMKQPGYWNAAILSPDFRVCFVQKGKATAP